MTKQTGSARKAKFRVGQVVRLLGEDTYSKILERRRETFGWSYRISEWAGWFAEMRLRALKPREVGR
jgi:hypothetical protein